MTSDVAWLQTALERTSAEIDRALDKDDRRAFVTWCRKRANLISRLESALLAIATAPVA